MHPDDFLWNTWVFQHVFNEGKEEGLRKARQEGVRKTLEELLIQFVEIRFPPLLVLAKQVIEQQVSVEQLETMLSKLYRANTTEEAQSALSPNG